MTSDVPVIRLIDWLERTWAFALPVGAFPAVLERLRGTPARAEALVAGVPDKTLRARPGNDWSVHEHLGHLDDLHELDMTRLSQFMARAEILTAADMSNARTETADHRATPIGEIIARFGERRRSLVSRMDLLTAPDIAARAIHPRLRRPIRLIDWAEFVADHDDHHLARAREVLRGVGRG